VCHPANAVANVAKLLVFGRRKTWAATFRRFNCGGPGVKNRDDVSTGDERSNRKANKLAVGSDTDTYSQLQRAFFERFGLSGKPYATATNTFERSFYALAWALSASCPSMRRPIPVNIFSAVSDTIDIALLFLGKYPSL
jgi:hypothetical protein